MNYYKHTCFLLLKAVVPLTERDIASFFLTNKSSVCLRTPIKKRISFLSLFHQLDKNITMRKTSFLSFKLPLFLLTNYYRWNTSAYCLSSTCCKEKKERKRIIIIIGLNLTEKKKRRTIYPRLLIVFFYILSPSMHRQQ
jgi:hypothetical protein